MDFLKTLSRVIADIAGSFPACFIRWVPDAHLQGGWSCSSYGQLWQLWHHDSFRVSGPNWTPMIQVRKIRMTDETSMTTIFDRKF